MLSMAAATFRVPQALLIMQLLHFVSNRKIHGPLTGSFILELHRNAVKINRSGKFVTKVDEKVESA